MTDKRTSMIHRQRTQQRGAALILTVIVIMVLTTLGIAMVTFTTTEERTATTYRDSMQARATAEAGVRIVQEMFRSFTDRNLVPLYSPTATADDSTSPIDWDYWGATEAAVDAELDDIGIWRSARPGAVPARYTGASKNFFQPPFGESWANIFGGTYSTTSDVYDLKFNCRNPANGNLITNFATTCWLETKLNALLDNSSPDWNLQTGRITDISFYAPPMMAGESYGITTVRVTAEKRECDSTCTAAEWYAGQLLARETLVAVIGDATPRPAVLGSGDVVLGSNGNRPLCGDGCEQIHANGDASVSTDATGGEDPIVSATGDAPGTSGDSAAWVEPPEINPWDLQYKPTTTDLLNKYYLVTARRLDALWFDGDSTNNLDPRTCGNAGLSWCQDYNLEYDTSGNPRTGTKARTAANTASLDDDPYMYRWNSAANEWTECDSNGDNTLNCGGGSPIFAFTRGADIADADATDSDGNVDNADLPFNKNAIPTAVFEIQSGQDGATVLVDGKFYKHGNFGAVMSIIAAGSIHLHSNTTWRPALDNKVMWLAGRDIFFHSDCCAPSGYPCPFDVSLAPLSGVLAAHEQILGDSNTHVGGIMIAEHRINLDTLVNDFDNAIHMEQGEHGYMCNEPMWPWTLPTTPVILSMTTAAD